MHSFKGKRNYYQCNEELWQVKSNYCIKCNRQLITASASNTSNYFTSTALSARAAIRGEMCQTRLFNNEFIPGSAHHPLWPQGGEESTDSDTPWPSSPSSSELLPQKLQSLSVESPLLSMAPAAPAFPPGHAWSPPAPSSLCPSGIFQLPQPSAPAPRSQLPRKSKRGGFGSPQEILGYGQGPKIPSGDLVCPLQLLNPGVEPGGKKYPRSWMLPGVSAHPWKHEDGI